MPRTYRLKYPIDARKPTLTYQLIVDCSVAAPQVAETPTIGFPFELTNLQLSETRRTNVQGQLTIRASTIPFTSGSPHDGYILHQITGNSPNVLGRHLVYNPLKPMVLTPRIRFPSAGWRIRLIHEVSDGMGMVRLVVNLTPLD